MSKLKVPSLQHLSRNWASESIKVKNRLINVVKNAPTFSYAPLISATRDLLVLQVPYDTVENGIIRGVSRLDVRENYLSVLPLIRDHFGHVRPDFVNTIDRRFYSVGRGLMVPFDPPMVYGVDGKLYFPWFSFWRQNPLDGERLSLFVTLVKEVLEQDPDLETAQFDILDFSAPFPKAPRELNVIDSGDVPIIGHARKAEMLEVFAEGYFQAQAELSNAPEKGSDYGQAESDVPGQPRLL